MRCGSASSHYRLHDLNLRFGVSRLDPESVPHRVRSSRSKSGWRSRATCRSEEAETLTIGYAVRRPRSRSFGPQCFPGGHQNGQLRRTIGPLPSEIALPFASRMAMTAMNGSKTRTRVAGAASIFGPPGVRSRVPDMQPGLEPVSPAPLELGAGDPVASAPSLGEASSDGAAAVRQVSMNRGRAW